MPEKDSNNIKPVVAGVLRDVFLTLPPDDKKFLEMIDRLGYSLDALYEKTKSRS